MTSKKEFTKQFVGPLPYKPRGKLEVIKLKTMPSAPRSNRQRHIDEYNNAIENYEQQQNDFKTMLLYFYKCYKMYQKHPHLFIHQNFRMTSLKLKVKRSNNFLPELVANMFFERMTRGNNCTGFCSKWKARPSVKFSAKTTKLLNNFYDAHLRDADKIWKDQQQKGNTVEVAYVFKFDTAAEAEMTMNLMAEVTKQTDNDSFYDEILAKNGVAK